MTWLRTFTHLLRKYQTLCRKIKIWTCHGHEPGIATGLPRKPRGPLGPIYLPRARRRSERARLRRVFCLFEDSLSGSVVLLVFLQCSAGSLMCGSKCASPKTKLQFVVFFFLCFRNHFLWTLHWFRFSFLLNFENCYFLFASLFRV